MEKWKNKKYISAIIGFVVLVTFFSIWMMTSIGEATSDLVDLDDSANGEVSPIDETSPSNLVDNEINAVASQKIDIKNCTFNFENKSFYFQDGAIYITEPYAYTGNAVYPRVTIYYDGEKLVNGFNMSDSNQNDELTADNKNADFGCVIRNFTKPGNAFDENELDRPNMIIYTNNNDKYTGSINVYFTIAPVDDQVIVSVKDKVYDGKSLSDPEVITNKEGTVAYEYALQSTSVKPDDSQYTNGLPTEAGNYYIKTTLTPNDGSEKIVVIKVATINKATGTGTVSIEDWSYNETAKAPITQTSTNGDVTIEYKAKDASDSTYTTQVPTEGGNYVVRATFAPTANYKTLVTTAEFTIHRIDGTGTVSLENWVFGTKENIPTASTETNHSATFEYKVKDADDSTYTAEVPTDVGQYTIKATFAENANYNAVIATADFEILKADLSVDTVSEKTYGDADFHLVVHKAESSTVKFESLDDHIVTVDKNGVVSIKGAGETQVKVSAVDNQNYNGDAIVSIKINKATGTGSVTLKGWVAETPSKKSEINKPVPKSDTNGIENVTYQYKLKDADDTTYTNQAPTNAGYYIVKATFAETNQYKEVVATSEFTVKQPLENCEVILTPSVLQHKVDENGKGIKQVPTVTIKDGDKTVPSSQYKVFTNSSNQPGKHYVSIDAEGYGPYYSGTNMRYYYSIVGEGTASVTIKNWSFGEKPNAPVPTSNTNGVQNVAYQYKLKDVDDSTYTEVVPSESGHYVLKSTFPALDYYNEVIVYTDFTIEKLAGNGSVKIDGWAYGEEANAPIPTSDTNGIENVTYQYKLKDADDSTYSEVVPTEPGDYTVKAIFAETNNYQSTTAVTNFTISKISGSGFVGILSWTYGDKEGSPVAISYTNGTSDVTYQYKVANAADSTYATKKPTNVGSYTVKAIFPETKIYTATTATTDFNIVAKPVSGLTVTGLPSSTSYTGSQIKPAIVVKDGNTTLKNGTDYTVTYGANTNEGNGTVTITGKGNYTGTTTKSFSIIKKYVSGLTISGIPSTKVYTGSQIKPTITVKDGNKLLKNNTDYTITYGENKNTGTATVKIIGQGNYGGSVTKTFYIVPKVPESLKLTSVMKGIKISYKRSTGATGYEIAYSTKKTSGFKVLDLTGTSKTINGLTSKKTYYVKVRSYRTVNRKKYYSSYTSVKSIKVK